MVTLAEVAVGVLCVWRVTHLLAAEDGPWDAVARLRRAAGHGMLGRLMDCFYCLSLWVAAPVAALLADGWRAGVPLWLALSGGAILLERATGAAAPALYHEDEPEEPDELLRREPAGGGEPAPRDDA
ncbi:MAG TPA: DUF1360 domain-containing protein [Longimicrobium sp.]